MRRLGALDLPFPMSSPSTLARLPSGASGDAALRRREHTVRWLVSGCAFWFARKPAEGVRVGASARYGRSDAGVVTVCVW